MNKSLHRLPMPRATVRAAWCILLCSSAAAQPASAPVPAPEWASEVRQLAQPAQVPGGARVEVEVGALDPRLKLAPCGRITPFIPTGARLWGHARVGLRCDEGARWSVYVPVTVKVYAMAWSTAAPLPAGTVIEPSHLKREEVDLAADPSPAIAQAQVAIGRALVRPVRPGQALREADLKPRLWFAAGETVRVITTGNGFAISADGQALGAGIDGQLVRVRVDGGRVVSGRAVADKRIEVAL